MATFLKSKILIIEDDVNLGYLIEHILNQEGYTAMRVKTGRQGIIEAAKNIHALYIIDIGLPDISGFKVVEHIRESNKDCPIIIITDRVEGNNELETFKKRATIFHKKPMNFPLLIIQINNYLLKNTVEKSFLVKDITVIENERKLSDLNTKIYLSRGEYELLALFLKSTTKVFTRSEILNRVMDRNKNSTDSSVDTLLSRLRKKLASLGISDLIQTVYKGGYKLNEAYIPDIKKG